MTNGRSKTVRIQLPKLHADQARTKDEALRFNVINCGRRFGKSLLGVDLTVRPSLAGYPVGWFSPTYKMLAEIWRLSKRVFAPVTTGRSEQEKRLELIGGGVLEFWSLEDPDSSRGRKYKRVIIDEAAKARHLEEAWTHAIRPTLADWKGDAWFLSTPKGLNYFYNLYEFAQDGRPGWYSRQFTTFDNPYISPTEIEDMRLDLPERVFKQEILALFLSDGAYFQNIDEAATVAHPESPSDHQGHGIYISIDWALENDWTVVVVGCQDCNRVVDWDRFNKIDFTYQREKIYTMCRRWDPDGVLPERNSIGEPNIEILIQAGLPIMNGPDKKPGYYNGPTTKPPLIQGLAAGLEHDGYRVPKEAAHELRIFEIETMPSGHPRFSAPGNQNDDWVIALALNRFQLAGGGWWIL